MALIHYFAAASLIVVGSAITVNDCPSSFTEKFTINGAFGEKCYGLNNSILMKYDDAEKYCQKAGGHLASVKNEEVNKYLHKTFVMDPSLGGRFALMIGLRFDHIKQRFFWADGAPLLFANFDSLSPALDKRTDDCYYMYSSSKWWYAWCVYTRDRFICEYSTSTDTSEGSTNPIETTIKKEDCPVITEKTSRQTHDNLEVFGDRCYSFERVYGIASFKDAQSFCQKKGGNLAKIDSEAVDRFIHDNLLYTLHFRTSKAYWVGLYYNADTDGYEWTDGTPLGDYRNFRHKNQVLTQDECVSMLAMTGAWGVERCAQRTDPNDYHAFVCDYQTV